jgi:DNA/RNA endonuclease YhcR with UshA esterase domain
MAQENKPAKEDVPRYDVSNQTTLQGRVQQVTEYSCPITGTVGTHLSVMSDGGGLVEVHVAPASFAKQYGMLIKAGDDVKVIGMKTVFAGKPAMLARTITTTRTVNKEVYTDDFNFRDNRGKPLW